MKYVLNFGDIGTEINPEVAYEMLGEGLTLARENLGMLKSQDRRFLVLLEPGREPLQDLLNKLFVIYEDYVDSWKPKDLGIVHRFLAREDYKSVAESVGIDPSSAWRRRRSLNIREYETIKEIILTVCNRS